MEELMQEWIEECMEKWMEEWWSGRLEDFIVFIIYDWVAA